MNVRPTAAIALALAAALLAAGCAPVAAADGPIAASGTVRDDVVTVRAPFLQQPAFDPTVGLPGTRTPRPAARPQPSSQPTVSAAVLSLEVPEGVAVKKGGVLARLDDRSLALGVRIAKTAAAKWHADARVIDQRLSDLATASGKLTDARSQVLSAIAQAKNGRAKLVAVIAQLEAVITKLPPGPFPWPGPGPDPRVMLPQLEGQLAKLDAGLAKANGGLAKLGTAKAKLADARSTVRGARSILREAALAADAGVPVAEAKRAQAVVLAPVDGTVVSLVQPGTVLMADAPVVRLRRAGPAVVDSYLPPADAARLRVGAAAQVTIDSRPDERFAGRVTDLRSLYEYPPNSQPSSEIHLSRAYRVTVTLDDASILLPAGTPADLSITP